MFGLRLRRSKESAITLADRALVAGQFEAALSFYRQALDRNPRNPPIWVQCGHALKEVGRLQEAEAAYRRALSYAPQLADPYLHLGHVLKLLGRRDEAQSAYMRAFALDASSADAGRELGDSGWDEEQLAQLRRAVAFPVPTAASPPARRRASVITLADRARDAGDWASAARLYRAALDRNPRRPAIWLQYGHAMKESGSLAEAETAYRTAVAYEPNAAEAWLQLGHLLKQRQRNDEAEAAYLRAFAIDRSLPQTAAELRGLGWPEDQLAELAQLTAPEAEFVPRPPVKPRRDTGDLAFAGASDDGYLYETPPVLAPEHPSLAGADLDAYLFLHPDVEAALGHDRPSVLNHWLEHGRREHRLLPGFAPYISRAADPARVLERPFGVNFYGFIRAKSGLGSGARGYLRALRAAQIPFTAANVEWFEDRLRITKTRGQRPRPYRINLFHLNADTVERFFRLLPLSRFENTYNIAIWAWELAALRPDWHVQFGAFDEVWGISDFTTRAIGAVSPVPVLTMHHVVEPDTAPRYGRAHFGLPADKFLFYCVFDVGSVVDRKNPEAVIQAFAEGFRDEPAAVLVLKFHSPHHDPERVRRFTGLCQRLPNVIVISDLLTEREAASLRLLVDCVVSAHRSEGFGLNLAEAMHLGIPVIATRYASNLDYMDDENSWLVDCRPTAIAKPAGPYFEHYVWAEPSVPHLRELMRQVFDDREGARNRARRAAEQIRERFSARAIGDRIRQRFAELGLEGGPQHFAAHYGRSKSMTVSHPISSVSGDARRRVLQLPRRRVISVIVPVFNVAGRFLERCIESVRAQSYPFWELCLADDGSTSPETLAVLDRCQGTDPRIRIRHLPQNLGIAAASNQAVEISTGEYIAMLDNDDELAPDALFEVANAVTEDPAIDCLYTDEDKIDAAGNHSEHYCKPDWSPEHLESVMYVLHMLVVRKSLFLRIGGFRNEYSGAQDYDLMLRISRETDRIHHIPTIAYHWRMIPGSAAGQVAAKPAAIEAAGRALADHVAVKYNAAAWVDPGLLPAHFRVRHRIVGEPAVTLLILTNNRRTTLPGRGDFVMADNLTASIQEKTSYPNYRVTVVDDGNSSAGQLHARREADVETVTYPGPVEPFNFAHKANFSMRQVRTEHVVLLNDDMEVINGDWLAALLEFSQLPEIGAVGAKLFHADGTLQHCGMVLGVNDGSAHIYHSFPGDFIGYNSFTHLIRNYSAVTGACFATRKSVWAQAKGLDEKFATDFNDTDFCLRLREFGYRIVFTPHAQLYHFENKSIVRSVSNPQDVALFRQRWSKYLTNDPYYNPNLARDAVDFRLRIDATANQPLRASG